MKLTGPSAEIRRYRIYTRIIAVLDVILATLGFFFNPFNDEVSDVPFLYWKITITCFIFEIWMIVSIHLFVAAQKIESQETPERSVKYCRYWLIVATLSFIVFEIIIVFPPGEPSPLSKFSLPAAILIYRFFATLIVVKYKAKLTEYSKTVSSELQNSINNPYPDVINSTEGKLTCKCSCGSAPVQGRGMVNPKAFNNSMEGVGSVDLLRLKASPVDPTYTLQLEAARLGENAQVVQFIRGVHV